MVFRNYFSIFHCLLLSFSLSLSFSVFLSLFLCPSLSSSISFYLPFFVFLSIFLHLSFCHFLCLSLSLTGDSDRHDCLDDLVAVMAGLDAAVLLQRVDQLVPLQIGLDLGSEENQFLRVDVWHRSGSVELGGQHGGLVLVLEKVSL